MATSKFRTQFNGIDCPSKKRFERTFGASATIPDQTMSIREIMERYARGLPFTSAKTPIYDIDDDSPDIRTLDLSEIEDLAIESRNLRERSETIIKSSREKKEAAKKEAAFRKKFNDEMSAEKSTNNT